MCVCILITTCPTSPRQAAAADGASGETTPAVHADTAGGGAARGDTAGGGITPLRRSHPELKASGAGQLLVSVSAFAPPAGASEARLGLRSAGPPPVLDSRPPPVSRSQQAVSPVRSARDLSTLHCSV